jgi:hypothetical protein
MTATVHRLHPKTGHGRFSEMLLSDLRPSPENDTLYRPVDPDDPEVQALARSIGEHGLREPIVVSGDGFIISGHRRRVACMLAGLDRVPVRREPVRRDDDLDAFLVLLREHNRQRDKSLDEKLREELVATTPDEAYQSLIEHRRQAGVVGVEVLDLGARRHRSRISKAKKPMLDAVLAAIADQRAKGLLPTSARRIHYILLNDPPLRHASKPDSAYESDKEGRCYKDLTDLLTRARLEGLIPMDAIADETRPQTIWNVYDDPRAFIREHLDGLLNGYWRNLMRSQPNHVEIVVEKNTVAPVVRPVAGKYCIPMTSGRGFCSTPPRHSMAERFLSSGKDKLVVLLVTDFDPPGEEIATSFACSMRDDFGVSNVTAIKVALKHEHIARFGLRPGGTAKKKSPGYKRFVKLYGTDIYELEAFEALPGTPLQDLVREAVDSVIDIDLFNAELDAERQDAAQISEARQRVHLALRGVL